MEKLLTEWQSKYDKLYDALEPKSGNYATLDWQNDGRLTELNNCMVDLRREMAKAKTSATCLKAIYSG